MPFGGFVQMKFEKFARYVWKPLFISKLISCFLPASTEEFLRVKAESLWRRGSVRGLSPRTLHCRPHFITNDFTRGLLKGGHRYLPFFSVCFNLFYGGEKMPMLSSSLSPQQIHSADFCMERQTFKTTTKKCHRNRLKLCSQTAFLPEPQWDYLPPSPVISYK